MRGHEWVAGIVILATACATTNRYRRISAEPVTSSNVGSKESPKGVVEDAARVGDFHIFDETTYRKIDQALKKYRSNREESLEGIRGAVCDGRRPRVNPTYSIKLILPKAPAGIPLDEATRVQADYLEFTRQYLKYGFLDEASDPKLLTEKFNSDFNRYKENVIDTEGERRWANQKFGVVIPFQSSTARLDIEKYYRNAIAMPLVPDFRQIDRSEWFYGRYFLATAFQKDRTIILTPKVSPTLVGSWGYQSYGTEMGQAVIQFGRVTESTSLAPYASEEDDFNLRTRSAYTISENKWKLEDRSFVQPMLLSVLEDIALLKQEFTFVFSREDVEQIFSAHNAREQQYFGISYETGKFSPQYAIDHANTIWSKVLAHATEIQEAAQDDGSVNFTLKLDMSLFCSKGASKFSLQSQGK